MSWAVANAPTTFITHEQTFSLKISSTLVRVCLRAASLGAYTVNSSSFSEENVAPGIYQRTVRTYSTGAATPGPGPARLLAWQLLHYNPSIQPPQLLYSKMHSKRARVSKLTQKLAAKWKWRSRLFSVFAKTEEMIKLRLHSPVLASLQLLVSVRQRSLMCSLVCSLVMVGLVVAIHLSPAVANVWQIRPHRRT